MTNYKYFRFYQPNPDKTKDKGDCAIRALCAATGKSWLDVFDALVASARKRFCLPNDMDNIAGFLETEGFTPCNIHPKKGQKRPTMKDLLKRHPNTVLVGRCAHHVLCARDGKVMDTWDSSERPLYKYWIKNEI